MRASPVVKAIAAAVSILVLSTASSLAFEEKPYDAASFDAAQSANKSIVVDVFAPWCPTCQAQQKVFQLLKDKPEYENITVFRVDFDNQKDALRRFNASQQSTLIAFKGTSETGRSAGVTRSDAIESLFKTTLN